MEKCNVIPATSDFNKKEFDSIGIEKLKRVDLFFRFLSEARRACIGISRARACYNDKCVSNDHIDICPKLFTFVKG